MCWKYWTSLKTEIGYALSWNVLEFGFMFWNSLETEIGHALSWNVLEFGFMFWKILKNSAVFERAEKRLDLVLVFESYESDFCDCELNTHTSNMYRV